MEYCDVTITYEIMLQSSYVTIKYLW